MKNYLIVGAGFSGAVLARALAMHGDARIVVIDSRDHVAGNCHTRRDDATGIMVHQYGPHIFHTDRRDIWEYVNSFGEFRPFVNRVKASIDKGVFSMPINLHTINQFFNKRLGPDEAQTFLRSMGDSSIAEPANFEEQAIKFIGHDLYEAFFKNYTIKQWGCHPTQLPASILKRLPVRFSYNDNYYNSQYQGIPAEGYTTIVQNILSHPAIEVRTGLDYHPAMRDEFDHLFYTGPIDAFYGHSLGRLGYRTVFWERQEGNGDMQGNAVINYPGLSEAHTRTHEHKHFTPWETHEKSLVFSEFSKETSQDDIPYYPKHLEADKELAMKYADLAIQDRGVSFLGRLATYRYLDMHHVISESLEFSSRFLKLGGDTPLTRFGYNTGDKR
jgi:UDP-galactopyranose mutase